MVNRQVLLRRRPAGTPAADDFEIAEAPIPPVHDGDVLRQTIYLSLDPSMRGRMSDGPSYVIKGFIVSDHADRMGAFLKDCGGCILRS